MALRGHCDGYFEVNLTRREVNVRHSCKEPERVTVPQEFRAACSFYAVEARTFSSSPFVFAGNSDKPFQLEE